MQAAQRGWDGRIRIAAFIPHFFISDDKQLEMPAFQAFG
jgi:hypothetical protein